MLQRTKYSIQNKNQNCDIAELIKIYDSIIKIESVFTTLKRDLAKLCENRIENKKQVVRKSKDLSFKVFIDLFPENFKKSKSFYKAAHHFYSHRMQIRSGKFSLMAMKRVVNKLKDYTIPIAISSCERAVESDWTGVFPESETRYAANSCNKPPHNSSVVDLDKTLGDYALDFIDKYKKLFSDDSTLKSVCDLYKYCKAKQERPEFKVGLRIGDTGYGNYCNWRDLIPRPYQILTGFIDWLMQEKHITDFRPGHFTSTGKSFTWYLDDLRKRINCDPFTGREL
jgi:hypothetical protein